MAKPDLARLLIDSALEASLRRELADAPGEVFARYGLSEDECELLRHPDHRLLPMLGAALARREMPEPQTSTAPVTETAPDAVLLPDSLLALTVVPCEVENRIAYAVWVSPIAEGVDPASLPQPAGAALPGRPMTPLHAVIQLSASQSKDGVGMWASFRQATNVFAPPPSRDAPNDPPAVQAAAAEALAAAPEDRYEKLAALARAIRGGEAP